MELRLEHNLIALSSLYYVIVLIGSLFDLSPSRLIVAAAKCQLGLHLPFITIQPPPLTHNLKFANPPNAIPTTSYICIMLTVTTVVVSKSAQGVSVYVFDYIRYGLSSDINLQQNSKS